MHTGPGLCGLETNGARPSAGTVMETISHIFFTKFIFADETTSK